MLSVYDQINQNKLKTLIIITFFVIFVTIIGYLFGYIYGGVELGLGATFFALVFSSLTSISSYYFSDKMVLAISGAKKVARDSNPQLYGILENLSIGAGLPKTPDLYVIEDTAPNAFATGRNPNNAVVAVTSGLLQKLNKRQLEGVIAHEIAHIKNYDIRLMTIVVVLVGAVTMIANIILNTRFSSRDDRKGGGLLILVGIVLALLSPVIAELIKLAVSRNREYLADASATLITRDPEGLAQALEIISTDTEPLEVANEATAHMYISNPLKKGKNADFFANLFNTHPPASERIRILRSM